MDSSHKRPVTRKSFPFDDVIINLLRAGLFLTNWKRCCHLHHPHNTDCSDSHARKTGICLSSIMLSAQLTCCTQDAALRFSVDLYFPSISCSKGHTIKPPGLLAVDLEQTKHNKISAWWCHKNGAIFRGTGPLWGEFTGEFPSQRPVTRSSDVFFDLRLNKRLSKQLWDWWFDTPSRSLWRHCNESRHRPYQHCCHWRNRRL